ncbi:hypothetical protein RB195_020492 [Necator americanus]|uniref:Uncharacterized protein n=1 Tax=Necator americanus TaxID=51031 RepID=A0ABR1CJ31_NECAM
MSTRADSNLRSIVHEAEPLTATLHTPHQKDMVTEYKFMTERRNVVFTDLFVVLFSCEIKPCRSIFLLL